MYEYKIKKSFFLFYNIADTVVITKQNKIDTPNCNINIERSKNYAQGKEIFTPVDFYSPTLK